MIPIPFEKLWPGGNETAIVTRPVKPTAYAAVGNMIMSQNPSIEQVGFLVPPRHHSADAGLEMMGGEFCGNAARCAAYVWARQNGRSKVALEVSGFSGMVHVEINKNDVTLLIGNDFIVSQENTSHGYLVKLQGIQHLIISYAHDLVMARDLLNRHQQQDRHLAAMGIIGVSAIGNTYHINPYIWVKATNTLIRETGCASGSIAAALAIERQHHQTDGYRIIQPSGAHYQVQLHKSIAHGHMVSLSGVVRELSAVQPIPVFIDERAHDLANAQPEPSFAV
ncbi:MAG: hypothetical protein WCT27_00645 [Patescibacteria group bacterium]|jgi:diaminopimelate epimerase